MTSKATFNQLAAERARSREKGDGVGGAEKEGARGLGSNLCNMQGDLDS